MQLLTPRILNISDSEISMEFIGYGNLAEKFVYYDLPHNFWAYILERLFSIVKIFETKFLQNYTNYKLKIKDVNFQSIYLEKMQKFFKKNGLLLNWKEFEKLSNCQRINTVSMIAPISNEEKQKLKDIFSKNIRDERDLNYSLSLIKRYNIINACYQKAQHYINLASNSLSVFNDCEEKNILENLTSFSLSRNF